MKTTSPSFQSRFLTLALRLMRMKQRLPWTGSETKAARAKPPQALFKKHQISARDWHGKNLWNIAPKSEPGTKHVLFLHGGSYVQSFDPIHWQLMSNLIERLHVTVIAPDYPLAPEHTTSEILPMIVSLYQELSAEVGAHNIILMGDSAGGGMCLALAQQLRDHHLVQPLSIVLLSPWLDVAMTTSGIQEIDPRDPILNVSGLRQAGKMYAGALEISNPMVSPIHGSFEHLAPITLFIGTNDILLPDCRKLVHEAALKGIQINYHEYPNMFHDWMLLPMPEANKVLDEIVKILEP